MARNCQGGKHNNVRKMKFSKSYKSSKNPTKQRNYRSNAPLHIKNKFLRVHLADSLKKKYEKRSIRVRKGDKVKIIKGQFSQKTGKVERVDIKTARVYIEGIETQKSDGTKIKMPVAPANLELIELDLSDKQRLEAKK